MLYKGIASIPARTKRETHFLTGLIQTAHVCWGKILRSSKSND